MAEELQSTSGRSRGSAERSGTLPRALGRNRQEVKVTPWVGAMPKTSRSR